MADCIPGFDDTYWSGVYGDETWTGSEWQFLIGVGNIEAIEPSGGWASGCQPDQIVLEVWRPPPGVDGFDSGYFRIQDDTATTIWILDLGGYPTEEWITVNATLDWAPYPGRSIGRIAIISFLYSGDNHPHKIRPLGPPALEPFWERKTHNLVETA